MDRDASRGGLSAFALHLLAMVFMLCDHVWATLVPGNLWLTCIGRLAFPLFAFLLAEGFFHTRSRKKYALRLLVFAVLSEVPFDLIYEGAVFDPTHQNVLWTLFLGFVCMWLIDRLKEKNRLWLTIPGAVAIAALGWLLATVLGLDYAGGGVLTVLVFYFFRGRKWWQRLGQLLGMYWIHFILIKGMFFPVTLFEHALELPKQGLAILALGFVWLYRGRQGPHNKTIQAVYYAFYPVHMLLLALVGRFLV